MSDTHAITLWQPWGSLVAVGAKTIETRSWSAPASLIGQPLLIHAAARLPRNGERVGDWQVYGTCDGSEPDIWALGQDNGPTVDLPLGAVVASCQLAACVPTESLYWTALWERWAWQGPGGSCELRADVHQRAVWPLVANVVEQPFGDFSPGRWAWLLEDVRPTTERCPRCWGRGDNPDFPRVSATEPPCPVCRGLNRCEPVPMKGRQRVWTVRDEHWPVAA